MTKELNPDDAPYGYVAVRGTTCTGCAFNDIGSANRCGSERNCQPFERSDRTPVIFVKRPDPVAAPAPVAPAAPAPVATHEVRAVAWVHAPAGSPIFAPTMTRIEIADEAAGEFVVLSQPASEHEGAGSIRIDRSEWATLRAAIDHAISQCRG